MGLSDLFLRPSIEDVVRDHGPHVQMLLRRLFGRSADVDDVFQNVFIEVMRSLPRFQGRAKLSTWIHRVALNVAYQEMRQQYGRARALQQPMQDGEEHADERADVHAQFVRADAARRVHAALASLPPKQRIAVALHDIHGHSLKEIADDLGLPLQTVASQVRVGRARLADALAELRGIAVDAAPPETAPPREEVS